MKALLEYRGEPRELSWGVNLIGADPSCSCRLETIGGFDPPPDFAALVFCWINKCLVISIGTAQVRVDGRAVYREDVGFDHVASGFASRTGPLIRNLTI